MRRRQSATTERPSAWWCPPDPSHRINYKEKIGVMYAGAIGYVIGHTVMLCLLVPLTFCSLAQAEDQQTRTFYNDRGQEVGRATTRGNTTTFSNDKGQVTGRTERRENHFHEFRDLPKTMKVV
jgi:hypothetical protein